MIAVVVAMAHNNAIGKDNQLLWHISEDLKYFKNLTQGGTVVMGRKTFESIGRPLPKRRNIVVTRSLSYKADGVEVVHSLDEALALSASDENIFIIGGGEIYAQAVNLADMLYITQVNADYEADTYFPAIDFTSWEEVNRVDFDKGSAFEHSFSFLTYKKV